MGQLMVVEPSWFPIASIPSDERQEGLYFMSLSPAAGCFGLQTDFVLNLPPLSCILQCSCHGKCHVLSLPWCWPDGAFSVVRHCHVSISMLSTLCSVPL